MTEQANFLLHDLASGPRFRAGLDQLAGFHLPGWALDLRAPAEPVAVEVLVAGELLGATATAAERPDIARFVPGSWSGWMLDLQDCEPERLMAALRALLPLPDDARALSLRLGGAAVLPPESCGAVPAEALRRAILALPPSRLLRPGAGAADAAPGARLLAALAGEAFLFDEVAHLRARPTAREAGRSELGAAFRDWLRAGEASADPDAAYPHPDVEALLLAEVALAEGRRGEAREALGLAFARLLDRPQAGLPEAMDALEGGWLGAEPWRERLLTRAAFFAALALEEGQLAAELAIHRLRPVLDRLHHAGAGGPSRLSDLRWWARLAPVFLGGAPAAADETRTLALAAWQQPPGGRRRRHPMPPTSRMRRVLLLAWACTAAAAGRMNEALAAALQLSRELLALRERPWRRALRPRLEALFAAEAPAPAALAAVLHATFEAGAPPRRSVEGLALLRLFGLDPAGMDRIVPEEEPDLPRLDAAFLLGAREGESLRYRVLNVIEALEARGLACTTLLPHEAAQLASHCGGLGTLVAFRAPLGVGLVAVARAARRLGARLLFDVDDLTFDPALAPEMRALDEMEPGEREGALIGLRLYREALLLCDGVTGSTRAIADAAEALGRAARVVPNTHGPFERHIARRTARAAPGETVTLGYFSGTWTHRGDFARLEAPLRAALARHGHLRLLVAGAIELGAEWAPFADRIERAPLLPHPLMLELYARVDASLAPLEHGARFCEAKSELKVFEAALFGVPSIASPTAPYAGAVADGEDGFLAADAAAWTRALDAVATDAPLRRRLGEAARRRAQAQFAERRAGDAWLAARAAMLDALPPPLSVLLLPPEAGLLLPPETGSEGTPREDALRLGEALALLGHRVALDRDTGMGTGDAALPVAPAPGAMRPDVSLATDAASVERLRRLSLPNPARLLLEDEAQRHPLGAARLRAEAAMAHPMPTLALGGALAARIGAARLDPAPERVVFHPRGDTRRAATLVVFRTDPDDPARCHALGLAALRQLRALEPAAEIVLVGMPAPRPREPGDPPPRRPEKLPDGIGAATGWASPEARARLFSAATVGLCFSPGGADAACHEMVASGLPVVDALSLGAESGGVTLRVEPRPEILARALARLLRDPAARAAEAARALRALDDLPGPIGQARQAEAWLRGLVSRPS